MLKTKNETVIETKGTHNHEWDPAECQVPPAHVKASFEFVIEELTELIERTVRRKCRRKNG